MQYQTEASTIMPLETRNVAKGTPWTHMPKAKAKHAVVRQPVKAKVTQPKATQGKKPRKRKAGDSEEESDSNNLQPKRSGLRKPLCSSPRVTARRKATPTICDRRKRSGLRKPLCSSPRVNPSLRLKR